MLCELGRTAGFSLWLLWEEVAGWRALVGLMVFLETGGNGDRMGPLHPYLPVTLVNFLERWTLSPLIVIILYVSEFLDTSADPVVVEASSCSAWS